MVTTLAGCSRAADDVAVSPSTVPVPVLVVDDHDGFRAAARTLIEATEGFSFAGGAGTGEGALSLAPDVRPAMVLMDVRLPGINGVEATRRLLAVLPGTVVLLCSTTDPADLPDGAATCGAVGYVRKERLAPAVLRTAWEGAPGLLGSEDGRWAEPGGRPGGEHAGRDCDDGN